MLPDDELCLCFHVTWRKVINYIRVHKVRVPSQLSECQNAGTGCGWCRPSLRRLVEKMQESEADPSQLESWLAERFPNRTKYHSARAKYIADGHGTPPSDSDSNAKYENKNSSEDNPPSC